MTAGLFLKKKSNETAEPNLDVLKISSQIIIPDNTFLDGCISTSKSIRIEGKLKGVLYSKEKITIDDDAEIEGDIVGFDVVVSGKILGNIYCLGKVIVKTGGKIIGNIYTSRFQNDEGSDLSSSISIVNNTVLQELLQINDEVQIGANLNQTIPYKKLLESFDPVSNKKKLAKENLPAL